MIYRILEKNGMTIYEFYFNVLDCVPLCIQIGRYKLSAIVGLLLGIFISIICVLMLTNVNKRVLTLTLIVWIACWYNK